MGVDACGQGAGSGADGLGLPELKMRVNSPGAEPAELPDAGLGGTAANALVIPDAGAGDGIAVAGGALKPGAALPLAWGAPPDWGEWIDRNIAVKLPGSLPPALAAGGTGAGTGAGGANGTGSGRDPVRSCAATAGKTGGVWPEAAIFSMGTGLNTLASSSEGRGAGALAGSGVFKACSMRVKSPGAEEAGSGAGGGIGAGEAVCGKGTGSAENSEDTGAAAGAAVGAAFGVVVGAAAETGADETGAGGGSGFLPSAASRSSSSRVEELGAVPKIPVALDAALGGDPPPGGSDWGELGLSKRSLNAFMGSTVCVKKVGCSGIQDYIDLA